MTTDGTPEDQSLPKDLISNAAAALRRGDVTAPELLEQHLQRIHELDPRLNSFITVDEAGAVKAAKASCERFDAGNPLSILDGIPIAVKDNVDVAGLPTSNGSSHFWRPENDALVSARLRAGGAVIVGKLNMHEGALGATTDNPHHGIAHNPWRDGHTPGGSSGGSGVAVAAGLVFAALGTDTLGSVRLPAAYCGIVGLKPTQGLVGMDGIMPLSRTLDHVGPLCSSVGDAAAMLSVLAGEEQFNEIYPLDQNINFGVLDPIADNACEPDVLTGFELAKSDLARITGATRVTLPDVDFPALRRACLVFIEDEGWKALSGQLEATPNAYSETFKSMLAYGRDATPEKKGAARAMLTDVGEMVRRLFSQIDILVLPAAPQLAFSFSDLVPPNQADFTGLANLSGCPSIVLPTGLSGSGLPLSVQLMSAPHKENTLLSTAAELEGLWGRLTPPI